jgi:hypothetical protein
MHRKFIILTIAAVLLGLSFAAESAEAASLRKGPYLIYPGDNTKMTVLWQVDSTTNCTLEWGLDTSYSDGSTVTTEYGSDHQHKFNILGLTPGSKYYYQVTVDSSSASGSFTAAPATDVTGLKLFAFGDTRSNPDILDALDADMVDVYEADADYQTIVLQTGDWVHGDSEDDWSIEWFDPNWVNIDELLLNVPVQGCWGNHEGSGVVYEKYYPYLYVNEQYWSFDYGPLHVVVLDQSVDYTSGSAQYNWLVNDLAGTDREWLFIILHKPGYTAGHHPDEADVQNYIQPLCVQYGVDIVFAGHNHYYARTTVEGVKHITTGGGGAPLYACQARKVEVAEKVNHFCKIDIAGNQLDLTTVDVDGTVIDSFTLSHEATPTPTPTPTSTPTPTPTPTSTPTPTPTPTQTPTPTPTGTPGPTIFSDGFESGDFVSGGWTISGDTATVSNKAQYTGTYGAKLGKQSWIEKAVSTAGYTDIHLKYARKTYGLDSGEEFYARWHDGTEWHILEATLDENWAEKDWTLGSTANNNPDFKIRFSSNGGHPSQEYSYLDDVEVSGTPQ